MSRLRRWIANKLVALARKVDPENREVTQFWVDRMMELVITGRSSIKISAVDIERKGPKP